MIFNFIFTFPEVNDLNDIVVSFDDNHIQNNIISFQTPSFHKPKGQGSFEGWNITKVEGDFSLKIAHTPLTKNNNISFIANNINANQTTYNTTIYCKMVWTPAIVFNLTWDQFDNSSSNNGKIMTISFDINSTDLSPKGIYSDDAINMVAGSPEWDDFFGHYPVLVKNGIEVVRLDPNDYSKDIQGNSVDIESGSSGDVMIAFPRRGLRISRNGSTISISFTAEANDSTYQYYAHTHNRDLDKFYVGAYNGFFDDNGRLRSLSGKIPTNSKSLPECREAAQLNGNNYEQFAFYQLVYLQAMFMMKYKNLDGQSSIGNGKEIVFGQASDLITGSMNNKGLDWGDTTSTVLGMKFAGIENFWGNMDSWVDGIIGTLGTQYTTTGNFDDNSDTYEFTHPIGSASLLGIPKDCIGTSEGGFIMTERIPLELNDGNFYFCDWAGTGTGYGRFGSGGGWATRAYEKESGPFALIIGWGQSQEGFLNRGSRLQKL